MTISSTVSRLSYAGNSSTTAFSVSFKFIDAEDLVVYLDDTLQTITTDYSVTGGAGSTGTITFLTAPATGETVTIVRDVALLQETDYVANDPFPAETHERALDRLTMIAQRNRDLLDRSLTLPDSADVSVSTALPAPAANEVIAWNADGTALVSKTVAEISSSVIGANTVVDAFVGDGATVAFTLSADPQTENNTLVFISGVYQEKTDYSVTGRMLTFSVAPPNLTTIQVIQQVSVTYPITTLTDGVVTTDKIVDGAVTVAKTSGFGTAATLDVGTTANKVVQLDGTGKLPAVDGSQLTGISSLPTQTGNSGKVLVTNGTDASWGNGTGSTTAQSMVRLNTANGYGSTNTVIPRFTNVVTNQGSDITYADSATLGSSFTVNNSGVYAVTYSFASTSSALFGLSVDSSQLTTSIGTITAANRLSTGYQAAALPGSTTWVGYLPSGSVVRPHTDGAAHGTSAYMNFTITRVS